jgi:nucleoside-diphosphate-sugar epimerase
MKTAIVTGAGGFIGSHLVKFLKEKGYRVTGVDVKKPEFSESAADTFILADLRSAETAQKVLTNCDELYCLAADMGGVGYISEHHADLMTNNVKINVNSLSAAYINHIPKVFYSSSACVYPLHLQSKVNKVSLKESDAIPAEPDTAYGWEKLFTEQLCQAYRTDYGLDVKVARFHNIYGPEGTFQGGREKSPAAICRKVALAKKTDVIEIWGDGEQTRSYCFIDDCCEGIFKLMHSSIDQPINIGSDRLISINDMAELVAKIAKKKLSLKHVDGFQGVRGRNSDNTLIKSLLNWQPSISLEDGLQKTYLWIEKQTKSVK